MRVPVVLASVRTLARTYGMRGAARRINYEMRRSIGLFRRRPAHRPTQAAARPSTFTVDPELLRRATNVVEARDRAERVVGGSYQAFRWDWRPSPGGAAEWTRHPRTGADWDSDAPWWRIPTIAPERGDIKELWEPARFGWAYDLVRGHLLYPDPAFARCFADRFGEWCAASDPFTGPHWLCGQEVAIRAVALLYTEANLPLVPETSRSLLDVLAASGERIHDAIDYGLSQRNNHGISEAVGLVAIGCRLRGAHPEANRWLRSGQALLESLIREQFGRDGWYIQHSFNYLRLALEQCVVAERSLRACGSRLSPAAVSRLKAAVQLLIAVMNPRTGSVPNHGANDGAFVHPVTLGGYRDFRPAITAAACTWGFDLPELFVPDRETAAWLGMEGPPTSFDAAPSEVVTGESGWAAVTIGQASVFLRAAEYDSRPGHIDPLHVDVRFGTKEIIVDPGTFAYVADPPWNNGLATDAVHNGPRVLGEDAAVKGPRFLWLSWPSAAIVNADRGGSTATVVARDTRGLQRIVSVQEDEVRIEDRCVADQPRGIELRWLLHPDADPSWVRMDVPSQVRRAEPGGVFGWFSPHYGERLPSQFVEARLTLQPGEAVVTTIKPPAAQRGGGVLQTYPLP